MADNLQMATQGTSFYDEDSGQNEVQTITVTADGGTFTVSFAGQTTDDIDFDATAAEVETALTGLSTIGANNADVTGDDGGPYTVTFVGALARTPVALLTADETDLTGVGAAVEVEETANGINGLNLSWGIGATAVREIVALPAAARSAEVVRNITAGNIVETASAVTVKPASPYGTDRARMSRRLIAPPSNGDTLTFNSTTGLWVPEEGK